MSGRKITIWSHPDFENLVAEIELDPCANILVTQNGPDEDFEIVIETTDFTKTSAVKASEFEGLISQAKTMLNDLGWKK